ncbi:MAG: HAD-IA family hydrolase [Vicinamibacterales bacterium]|nr:HAD-IA family hydrolase [Vicinamibacterales bacterium]
MLVVFDFDGTLMDTLRDLAEAAGDLAEAYGGARLSEAQTAAMIGDGAPLFVQRILATTGIDVPPPEAVTRYLDFYERRVFDHTAPYSGVAEMLGALAPRHRLALLTNKPEASTRALMRHTGLDTWFEDCVFGDGDLARKPDPAGLQWLMARAGADPALTLMVGDSVMDLDAARAAGTQLCLARYGFGFMRVPAGRIRPEDILIDRPVELVARLAASETGG